MDERGVTEKSIFTLVKDFVSVTKKYHDAVEATWDTPTALFFKSRKEGNLVKEAVTVAAELQARYVGVMSWIYKHTNPGAPALSDERWQGIHDATWLIVQDRAVVMYDYRSFFGALWGAYRSRMKVPAAASPMKPKFMLLPFVDEMPECDERSALLAAYGFPAGFKLTDWETVKLIKDSFALLHRQLLSHSTDLDMTTDRVANGSVVREMSSPFDQLRNWVLPPNTVQEVTGNVTGDSQSNDRT